MCLSYAHVIYTKIKFEIDIHIDKLLGIKWEHISEIKKKRKRGRCEGGGILLGLEPCSKITLVVIKFKFKDELNY